MSISQLIKDGRARLGLKPHEFGARLGVSRGSVQQWENGTTAPARKHQQAVADLIGISVGELMSGISEKYPPAIEQKAHLLSDKTARYSGSAGNIAADLVNAMNPAGQKAAIEYLRFLLERHPSDFSSAAADCAGDTLPRSSKAA